MPSAMSSKILMSVVSNTLFLVVTLYEGKKMNRKIDNKEYKRGGEPYYYYILTGGRMKENRGSNS